MTYRLNSYFYGWTGDRVTFEFILRVGGKGWGVGKVYDVNVETPKYKSFRMDKKFHRDPVTSL